MTFIINHKRKNRIQLFTIVGFILIIGCKNTKTEDKEAPLKKVKYTVIDYANSQKQKTFNGETQSATITNLSFRMGGIITQLNAKVGKKVKKGELLAQLDTKDIDLTVQQINEGVQGSKVQLETAKSTLDRTKRLYQSQGASLADFEGAKNNYAQAKASYESNQKSLSLSKPQYDYAKIIAPITGIISKVNAEKNEVVNAGSNIITIDSDNGKFQVKVSLPENYINEIKLNDQVNIVINNKEKIGVVSEIGYAAKGASFPVTITINNPDNNLRPGLSASVTFNMGAISQNNVLVVPIEAVRQDGSNNYVYQLLPKGEKVYQVSKTAIKIGEVSGNDFNIISGIKKDAFIAIAGLNSLYDGMQVTLLKNN